MADIGRAAAFSLSCGLANAVAPGRGSAAIAALGQLEAQRTADRIGLRQPKLEPLADAVGLAAFVADQLPCRLVEAEIFAAEVAREQQAVAAEPLDRGEEAEALHPGDAATDDLADPVREERRDIAVDGLALGQVIKPGTFNRVIERVGDADFRPEVMEQLLRTQMQARYSPERLGHFGLALATYAHFTSPIRRYADLLVHRALVRAYRLGDGGLPPGEDEHFEQIGEAISMLERRAMEAERETIDRYVAAFLADRVGQLVECRITGVQPFGFFATVEGLGGDGLVPAAILGREYFRFDEAARALVGDETGETFRQGQRLTLRLAAADPVSGSLRFELPEGSYGDARESRSDRIRPARKRGRPANIRHRGKR